MLARVKLFAIATAAVALLLAALVLASGPSSPGATETGLRPLAAHLVSVYPNPGSKYASPDTQISMRGATTSQLKHVKVSGSKSGSHSGKLVGHSDHKGASFFPKQGFLDGETVTVRVGRAVTGASGGVAKFKISKPVDLHEQPQGAQTGRVGVERFVTAPNLQPSKLKVNGTTSGYIFLSPKAGPSAGGPMIVDGKGQLVWFQPLLGADQSFDFRVQSYHNRPVLTWWQGGQIGGHGVAGAGQILNGNYRRIATVRGGNGYTADIHEFKLTDHDTALITVYNPVRANLKSVGGPSDGVAFDGVIQEIDIATGAVEFEWHSLDHVGISNSFQHYETGRPYDYFHINSIDEINGDILASARAVSTIYDIRRADGALRWKLGGKHSSFKMGPGTDFRYQHDARPHGSDEISLFDNNAAMPAPGLESSGKVIKLDTKNHKATLVHAYAHPSKLLSASQGNTQLLSSGHVFVGWGGNVQRVASEFSKGGTLLWDASLLTPNDNSYRAYRQSWTGNAPGSPTVVGKTAAGQTTVYVSWNGATKVAKWRVLAGVSAASLTAVSTVARSGFETAVNIPGAQAFVQVEALSSSGKVLGRSPAVASTAG